jgi:acetyl-CoA synthetase
MMHARARAIITADYAVRRGARTELVDVVDKAMGIAGIAATVFVLHREGGEGEARSASHVTWDPKSPTTASWETEILDAEAPAMLMYTSGTTGEPKGTVHTHCGMLVKNALDMSLCVDMKASDRLLWMSDMGWIAGPKMILSSALAGATLVMAEGTPTWPQSDRLFAIAEKHKVTMLGIVPTIVRQVMKTGGLAPDRDLTSLRVVVSAGEPWTDDAWWWFFDVVGKKKVPILNYAGGTECGGAILVGTLLHPLRPGSFGGPVPGCGADIVDANGKSVDAGVIGELVMRKPSIGLTRGLWRAPERYLGYWRQIPGMWVQGDLASRDSDGLWYLHGRSDDVIKIAGKRTGPAEIESIVMQTGLVKDCVVIGISDPITGSALMCVYVPVKSGEEDAGKAIGTAIAEHCGASYRPKHFLRVSDLPRTRNEKSMRRVVRSIVLDTPMGDTSSLANPAVIDEIREATRLQLPNILKAS